MIKCDGKQNHVVKTAFIILMIAALMIVPPSPPAEALITEGVAATVFVVLIGLVASAAGLKIIYDNINSGSAESYWSGKYLEWQNSRVSSGSQAAVTPLNTAVDSWLNVSGLLPYPTAFGFEKICLGATAFGAIRDFLQWVTVEQGATDGISTDFQSDLYDDSTYHFGDIPVVKVPFSYQDSPDFIMHVSTASNYNVYAFIANDNSYRWTFVCPDTSSDVRINLTRFYHGNQVGADHATLNTNNPTGSGLGFSIASPSWGVGGSTVYTNLGGINWANYYIDSSFNDIYNYIRDNNIKSVTSVGSAIDLLPAEGVDQLKYPALEGTDSIGIDTTIPWTGADSLEDVLVSSLTEVLSNTATAEYADAETLDVPATDIPAFDGNYPLTTPSLTNKFPFCIPFDIFRMASAFKANPVTPVIDYEMDFGVTVYCWHLDFSIFDGTAALLRRLELIGFVGALAYATKYLIHW